MATPRARDDLLLDWRVRKHLIDYLELAASFDQQNAYQAAVPFVHVPNEVVSQWEDWVSRPEDLDYRGPPAYSAREITALKQFGKVWGEVCAGTPTPLPAFEVLQRHPEWLRLANAAQAALSAMMIRGPFPPERPLDPGD